jgi:altronate dehydratase small subunit
MVKDAISINKKDNVATAIRDLPLHTTVSVGDKGNQRKVKLIQLIPFGHKFALTSIPEGGSIIKYGEVIGVATQKIESGEHVHIHNVRSDRGR